MYVYDPYYIHDPSDHDLYDFYCKWKHGHLWSLLHPWSFWPWSLQSLSHNENMDVYDPYHIHDPPDHDLCGPYCIIKDGHLWSLLHLWSFWPWFLTLIAYWKPDFKQLALISMLWAGNPCGFLVRASNHWERTEQKNNSIFNKLVDIWHMIWYIRLFSTKVPVFRITLKSTSYIYIGCPKNVNAIPKKTVMWLTLIESEVEAAVQ